MLIYYEPLPKLPISKAHIQLYFLSLTHFDLHYGVGRVLSISRRRANIPWKPQAKVPPWQEFVKIQNLAPEMLASITNPSGDPFIDELPLGTLPVVKDVG